MAKLRVLERTVDKVSVYSEVATGLASPRAHGLSKHGVPCTGTTRAVGVGAIAGCSSALAHRL